MISTKEQEQSVIDATTEEKPKKKSKEKLAKKEKKVKWTASNRSKSYGSSMKGLRSPKVAQAGMKSPDKSILLKK